jgi:hypothetical protein
MTTTLVMNGKLSLVVRPENELEKVALIKLLEKEVTVELSDKIQILDGNYLDCIIISQKTTI